MQSNSEQLGAEDYDPARTLKVDITAETTQGPQLMSFYMCRPERQQISLVGLAQQLERFGFDFSDRMIWYSSKQPPMHRRMGEDGTTTPADDFWIPIPDNGLLQLTCYPPVTLGPGSEDMEPVEKRRQMKSKNKRKKQQEEDKKKTMIRKRPECEEDKVEDEKVPQENEAEQESKRVRDHWSIEKLVVVGAMWWNMRTDTAHQRTAPEAAMELGVMKKTLDTYMPEVELGAKYRFNFNAHRDDMVRVLKDFNKNHQQKPQPDVASPPPPPL
jgi:hypothetical protein